MSALSYSGAALSSSRRDAALLPASAQPSGPFALLAAADRISRLMDDGWIFDWEGHEDPIIEAFDALDAALDGAAQGWIYVQHRERTLEPPRYPLLRLPVLVTIADGVLRHTAISGWTGERWIGVAAPAQVLAWMPLPAPARGATKECP